MEQKDKYREGWQVDDIRWEAVSVGYLIGLLVTAVVGMAQRHRLKELRALVM
ncbi:MAG: hypothetical protein HYU86_06425 [Chloroflexi bacterium]|nr:hypothetical protein [Chloroflexota bacterium]